MLGKSARERTCPTSVTCWPLRASCSRATAPRMRPSRRFCTMLSEDQGGKPRLADIRARFRARVAEIVEACSDSLEEDPSKKDEVLGRKARYRDELRAHPDASVYLVSAPTSCTIPVPWPKTNEKVAQSFGRGSRPVRWSSYKICTPCSTSMKACTRSEWRA